MNQTIDPTISHIYEAWHDTVRKRDLAGTAALYATDALLETPLALAVYPERQSGLIRGRIAIKTFFEDSLRKFPGDLGQWYRTGTFFANGQQLTWEYPREAPKGEQVDLMEMMEIEHGLIQCHRVYWGWYGVRLLTPALTRIDASSAYGDPAQA